MAQSTAQSMTEAKILRENSMDTMIVNGVEYVPKHSFGNIKIVVLDRGYVYVGRVKELEDRIEISQAKNIIRWGTSEHLGQLEDGPLERTKLGKACHVTAYKPSVMHMIDVDQTKWGGIL